MIGGYDSSLLLVLPVSRTRTATIRCRSPVRHEPPLWPNTLNLISPDGFASNLSVSVCLCLSLSVSVCLCLSLSVSVCLCLSLSVSVCLCLSLSVSVCLSVCLSFCVFVCLFVCGGGGVCGMVCVCVLRMFCVVECGVWCGVCVTCARCVLAYRVRGVGCPRYVCVCSSRTEASCGPIQEHPNDMKCSFPLGCSPMLSWHVCFPKFLLFTPQTSENVISHNKTSRRKLAHVGVLFDNFVHLFAPLRERGFCTTANGTFCLMRFVLNPLL